MIFAYHGHPWLIHPLTYRRTNHGGIHVRGYKEEGTTTTPFDMLVKNEMGRFNLIADAAARIARMSAVAGYVRQEMRAKLVEHKEHITRYGEDLPEVKTCRRFATGSGSCSAKLEWRVSFPPGNTSDNDWRTLNFSGPSPAENSSGGGARDKTEQL